MDFHRRPQTPHRSGKARAVLPICSRAITRQEHVALRWVCRRERWDECVQEEVEEEGNRKPNLSTETHPTFEFTLPVRLREGGTSRCSLQGLSSPELGYTGSQGQQKW